MTIYCPICSKPKRWWQREPSVTDRPIGIKGIAEINAWLKATHRKCANPNGQIAIETNRILKTRYGRPPQ